MLDGSCHNLTVAMFFPCQEFCLAEFKLNSDIPFLLDWFTGSRCLTCIPCKMTSSMVSARGSGWLCTRHLSISTTDRHRLALDDHEFVRCVRVCGCVKCWRCGCVRVCAGVCVCVYVRSLCYFGARVEERTHALLQAAHIKTLPSLKMVQRKKSYLETSPL